MLATKDRSAAVTPAVRKVSTGASEIVALASVANLSRTLDKLKEKGFWVVGTALSEGSVSIAQADLSGPLALVLGSEGKGLRKLTKEKCDVLVQIPTTGRVQSLNVSQAAAIFLYEIRRRQGVC